MLLTVERPRPHCRDPFANLVADLGPPGKSHWVWIGLDPPGSFLPRLVGISQALDWCYSGRVFPAAEAKAGGLVKEIYPKDQLMDAAKAWCREIIDNTAPVSVSLTRQMMWQMLGADHPMEAHIVDSRAIFERGKTMDAKEGVMSFLEKRKPEYPEKVSSGIAPHYPWKKKPTFKWPEKAE